MASLTSDESVKAAVPAWPMVFANLKRMFAEASLVRRLQGFALLMAILISNGMQFFGMNFLLYSFDKGSPMFTTLVLPTFVWAVVFTSALGVVQCTRYAMPNVFFVFRNGYRRVILLLTAIGVLDAIAGLTSAFSTYHTPMVLQSLLMSLSPLWTHVGSEIVGVRGDFPHPPRSLWLVVDLALFFVATLVTLIPHLRSSEFAVGWWTLVFLISCVTPPMYNVLQGRFLTTNRREAPGWAGKLMMLSVDTLVQCVCCVAFFPADFSPWFGETEDAASAWKGFADGVREIVGKWDSAAYFLVYTFGYVANHASYAVANQYSPTLGAAVGQLGGPVNTLLVVAVPALNSSKMKVSLWLEIISTVLVVIASVGYVILSLRHITTQSDSENHTHTEHLPLTQEFVAA